MAKQKKVTAPRGMSALVDILPKKRIGTPPSPKPSPLKGEGTDLRFARVTNWIPGCAEDDGGCGRSSAEAASYFAFESSFNACRIESFNA